MSARPAVSVVMAAYNGAALIGETLATLAAQTLPDFEVIVVDDRSTDTTLDVLRGWRDPRLRVIALEQNGGPVRARNRAVAEARGRYIAALDQDDLCHPTRFARQVAYLDAHPETVMVAAQTRVLEDGVLLASPHVALTTPALLRWLIRIENPLVWSSVMIRAEAARALDPFSRPDILYAEDFDLYHRLSRLGAIARIDAPLVTYRRHAGGASQRYEEAMLASAQRVLAENYVGVLSDQADAAAMLVVRHLMHGDPAPDRATLQVLGGHIVALQQAFLAERDWDAADRRLVRWTTARRWAGVARASLRAGTVTLADAMRVRPPHLGLGHAGIEQLLWSRLIGGTRAMRRRVADHTFAA